MKTAVKILKIILSLIGAVLLVLSFIPGTGFTKVWSFAATIVLPFAMDIIRFTGVKISRQFELAYLLFLIPAMIMGVDFSLYQIIYPLDKIAHSCSGILAAFGAKEILDQASTKPDQLWFKALWTIAFVALTAVAWECFEFACDQLIDGSHMQQLITSGIEDTMYDMIVALIGGVIGVVIIFSGKQHRRSSRA